ncbi:MAG: hypothetical protein K1X79_06405 [Oligoflexia bacterium]|nr:hypothetical protein [Oligoflexia bacterium]
MKRLLILSFLTCILGAQAAYAGPFDTCQYSIKIKDGKYGFVWKPSGAHRVQAVLVLPSRFKGFLSGKNTLVVRSVTIYRADNLHKISLMPMKSHGICAPGGECLDRPTFAEKHLSGLRLAKRYGNIRIRVVTNLPDGKTHVHCTKEFNPQKRQD